MTPVKQSPEQLQGVAAKLSDAYNLVKEAAAIADGFEPGVATDRAIDAVFKLLHDVRSVDRQWQYLVDQAKAYWNRR